jgi:hypothetical protein
MRVRPPAGMRIARNAIPQPLAGGLSVRQASLATGALPAEPPRQSSYHDQQDEAALLAQGVREIFRFAEHRCGAARHLSSPRRPGAGRTRLLTGDVLPLSHRSCRA